MCIKVIPTFSECRHSSPYIDSDDCPTKDCADRAELTERRELQKGICFECMGVEAVTPRYEGPTLYYKHCFESQICDHEYDHMLTEAERDPLKPEAVLVTPIPYDICPDCKTQGFDQHPGGSNPPPKTASVMPHAFQDLPRQLSFLPPSASLAPESFDLPAAAASRLKSKRKNYDHGGPSRLPSQAPAYMTMAPNNIGSSSSKVPPPPPSFPPPAFKTSYPTLTPSASSRLHGSNTLAPAASSPTFNLEDLHLRSMSSSAAPTTTTSPRESASSTLTTPKPSSQTISSTMPPPRIQSASRSQSLMPTTSKSPSYSSFPSRSAAPGGVGASQKQQTILPATALPMYKSMAGPQSAFPSRAPPGYVSARGKFGGGGQIPEGDEGENEKEAGMGSG